MHRNYYAVPRYELMQLYLPAEGKPGHSLSVCVCVCVCLLVSSLVPRNLMKGPKPLYFKYHNNTEPVKQLKHKNIQHRGCHFNPGDQSGTRIKRKTMETVT